MRLYSLREHAPAPLYRTPPWPAGMRELHAAVLILPALVPGITGRPNVTGTGRRQC
jgi:hypothetical protein